jgi:CIC family chloride channel protein
VLTWLADRLPPSDDAVLLVLAMTVGLISGLGAFAFHQLIHGTELLLFERLPDMVDLSVFWLVVLLMPTCGGLLVGLLIWLLARHDHSHGTAAVMEAVALRDGRLPARPFVTKIMAAGLLIGTGGSAGPEDPSVQVGAIVGSSLGNYLRLSVRQLNTLVTAGVASAIGAMFNAPIAGVFFALEIIAGDFSAALFAAVVLASVVGSIVGRALLGSEHVFPAPPYGLINPWVEAPLYVLLGLVAAVVGVAFVRAIFASEGLFDKLRLAIPLRAGLGGLLLGVLALATMRGLGVGHEHILGVGYTTISDLLNGVGPLGWPLLGLLAAKFAATIITLSTARVGGTFAPSLVLGAIVGGLFGQVVNTLLPGLTAPPAAFALVGMGAMLTVVVRAPITAVLLLFEVTGDYFIILAIMASVGTSYVFSQWLYPESIYTARLARKGIQLRFGRDLNILELVTVGEVMTPDFTTVPTTMPLRRLEALFSHTRHHGFPVLDEEGKLYGIVTLTDLRYARQADLPLDTLTAELATTDLLVVYPDQSLNTALRQFGLADVGRIPVVDRDDPSKLLGVVRRRDIVKAYQRGTMYRAEIEHRRQQMSLIGESGAQLLEVVLPPQGACDGRMLRELNLPGQAIITSIQRGGRSLIPRGDAVLHGGDRLSLLVMPEQAEQVRMHLLQGTDLPPQPDVRYHEVRLPRGAPACQCPVASLNLPHGVLIVTLRRDNQVSAVHGETELAEGDELIILSPTEHLPAAIRCLTGEALVLPDGPPVPPSPAE